MVFGSPGYIYLHFFVRWFSMPLNHHETNGANEDPATVLQLQPREINRNYTSLGSFSGHQGNKMLCAFFLLSKSIQIKIDLLKHIETWGVAPNRFLPQRSRSIHGQSFDPFLATRNHIISRKNPTYVTLVTKPSVFYQRQMKEIEGYKLVHPKKSYKVPYILLWIQADFTTNSYIICSPFFRFLSVWNKHKQTIHINSNALGSLFNCMDSTTSPNPESWCHLVASSHHWANYKKCEPPVPHDQWIPGNQKNGSTSPNCEYT